MAAKKSSEAPVSAAPASPYGEDVPVFVWEPKEGGEPIVFPKASTVIKPGRAIGFFLKLNKIQDIPKQILFLMDQAGVPDDVQFRVADLGDGEITELVGAWTGEVGATPGE